MVFMLKPPSTYLNGFEGVWGFNTNPYINRFLLCFVLAYLFPYLPTWDLKAFSKRSQRAPLSFPKDPCLAREIRLRKGKGGVSRSTVCSPY